MIEHELRARMEAKEPPTEAEIMRAVLELERLRQESCTLWRAISGER